MGAPIDEVVDLHEIDYGRLQPRCRRQHLLQPRILPRGPDLGRNEGLVACAKGSKEIADNGLGAAVHGR